MIYEVIYTSVPTKANPDINTILETSRRRNVQNDITGLLCYDGMRFLQILEGEQGAVADIYASIAADYRHRDVSLLHTGLSAKRSFKSWSMAYSDTDKNMLEALNQALGRVEQDVSQDQLGVGSHMFRLFFQASYKAKSQ